MAWTPDGAAVLVLADSDGRRPVFRIDVATGEVTQVTHATTPWSDLVVDPEGRVAYGVRSSYLFPPEVARLDLASGEATPLPGPAERPQVPAPLEEVETTADDGTRVRPGSRCPGRAGDPRTAAAVDPRRAVESWNSWTWRWSPWLMVAQGYAVLLPDPALSTGYGQHLIQRGWGRWGDEPYTDLMAATDAAVARRRSTRPHRGHGRLLRRVHGQLGRRPHRPLPRDRHARILWALEGFGPTTDAAYDWEREMTPEKGPHRTGCRQILTPMLVIHGDKDYRVPIGEGLGSGRAALAVGPPQAEDGTTPHRFLYFPQENHWIMSPQHATVWYSVVSAFLAEHVLGEEPPPAAEHLGLTPPPAPDAR